MFLNNKVHFYLPNNPMAEKEACGNAIVIEVRCDNFINIKVMCVIFMKKLHECVIKRIATSVLFQPHHFTECGIFINTPKMVCIFSL